MGKVLSDTLPPQSGALHPQRSCTTKHAQRWEQYLAQSGKIEHMRTHIAILSLGLLLGATSCSDTNDKDTIILQAADGNMVETDAKTAVVPNDEAIERRAAQMDDMVTCVRASNADTWRKLSLTTDQIRWMEQLQLRMLARNQRTVAVDNKDASDHSTFTFSPTERRRLAEILTDEQLEQWKELCADELTTSAR